MRASDGKELRAWSWEHDGPTALFVERGRDDARMFREELERAGRGLAARLVASLN